MCKAFTDYNPTAITPFGMSCDGLAGYLQSKLKFKQSDPAPNFKTWDDAGKSPKQLFEH